MTRKTILLGMLAGTLGAYAGTSCRDGVAKALPVRDGKAPAIDGRLDDWDRSGAVLCWNSEQFADRQNCTLYFMYDAANLYVAAEQALFDHDAKNPNRPGDRYWQGDLIQLRLSTDKSLRHPLPQYHRGNPAPFYVKNDKVTCVNLWINTQDASENLFVTPGAGFDCPTVNHPEGSAVRIVERDRVLTYEARIPWTALGVRDGRCPFAPGERMTAVCDIKWFPGSDGHFAPAIFVRDPGAFAFMNVDTWGQIEFLAKGNLPPPKETYASIAQAARERDAVDTTGWAEIRFTLPKRAKVSVNVFDEKGGVIRELIGGELREAGEVKAHWDGRDALGFPCAAGRTYRWGAYAHDGLDVEYFGTVGTSGHPPYETKDRTGGWGADHGPVVACVADETGRYFIWHMSESGCALVKTDLAGKTLWRTNPFVVTGWGNYTCGTVAGEYLYLVFEAKEGKDGKRLNEKLVKIDRKTGNYENWTEGASAADVACGIENGKCGIEDRGAVAEKYWFNCAGVAVVGGEIFLGDFGGNRILVHDLATGAAKRMIDGVRGPRGLAVRDGVLYAAVYDGKEGAIVRIDEPGRRQAHGDTGKTVVSGLVLPHGIAFAPNGNLYVSDLGASQQVKEFIDGKPGRVFGRAGGRGLLGKIDFDAFLMPYGIAVDSGNVLLVPEASTPKIVTLIDLKDGTVKDRRFGYTAYSPSNVPDPDDPMLQYYSLSGPDSLALARLGADRVGRPFASWDFVNAGRPELGSVMSTMNMPEVKYLKDGRKYLIPDGAADHRHPAKAMTICRVEGDDLRPVAGCCQGPVVQEKGGRFGRFRLWSDANGDGRQQEDEFTAYVGEVRGRRFQLATTCGALFVDDDGNLFLTTLNNFVIGVPAAGFTACGAPKWDVAKAYVAIPEIMPGFGDRLYHTWRQGLSGLRRDRDGNFYGSVACTPKYATEAYGKYMHGGMGHTADVGAVYMTKYDRNGALVWKAGRKAVGGMKDGEILHHWVYAGMIGDGYSVAASEWGVFTVYTADGFYVDHLFDVPGLPGRGIPYSFGGEDFSGRIQYFPKRGETWAFNAGHTFRVKGVDGGGRVKGEWRAEGTVKLEKAMPLAFPGAVPKELEDVVLKRVGGRIVFTAHVVDATPLVNVAAAENSVFKGGDAVGFSLGPRNAPDVVPDQHSKGTFPGFTRLLAARTRDGDRVVAFKPTSTRDRRPQRYATPAGGTSSFDYCGAVEGGRVAFTVDGDGRGYAVEISVPEAFFELDFSKPVFWEAELLLSGEGGRGVQAVKKVHWNSEESGRATMVDDVPTESRLWPKGWKRCLFR